MQPYTKVSAPLLLRCHVLRVAPECLRQTRSQARGRLRTSPVVRRARQEQCKLAGAGTAR
jgi:hypothetical protein